VEKNASPSPAKNAPPPGSLRTGRKKELKTVGRRGMKKETKKPKNGQAGTKEHRVKKENHSFSLAPNNLGRRQKKKKKKEGKARRGRGEVPKKERSREPGIEKTD